MLQALQLLLRHVHVALRNKRTLAQHIRTSAAVRTPCSFFVRWLTKNAK
jgi:hypothetical protein